MAARGRPRQFDADKAVQAAMVVFWKQGFEATSCEQLLGAMQINAGSMYSTFGGKKELFLKSLDQYADEMLAGFVEVLDSDESPIVALRGFFRWVESNVIQKGFCGCMLTNTMIEFGGSDDEDLAIRAHDHVKQVQRLFLKQLTKAQELEEIAPDTDTKELASFLISSMQGLSVLGRAGASRETIRGAVNTILTTIA